MGSTHYGVRLGISGEQSGNASATAWSGGSVQEMVENTGSQREGGQPQGNGDAGGFLQNPLKERKPPSCFSGSRAAQMDELLAGSRTAVSCPTPDPGEALHRKCELGVRPGERSAPCTDAPMRRGLCRGSSAWGWEGIRSRVMTALDALNKPREAAFPLVTTGWGFSALVRRG